MGLYFLTYDIEKKEEEKRVIYLCVLPRAMGMAMQFLGFREEKERRKQNILRIRGESNTEKGLAGKKEDRKFLGKESGREEESEKEG